MGTGISAKKPGMRSKKKEYKRACKTGARRKDIDQIIDDLSLAKTENRDLSAIPFNDELPGCGQFFSVETDKHFISQKALDDHKKTREYKRRVKQLKEEKYDQKMAEWAAGMTKEVLPPAHPKK
jgi:bud site selection protein 20